MKTFFKEHLVGVWNNCRCKPKNLKEISTEVIFTEIFDYVFQRRGFTKSSNYNNSEGEPKCSVDTRFYNFIWILERPSTKFKIEKLKGEKISKKIE